MKTTINNITIEGTPAEIQEYILLLQPAIKPHNTTTTIQPRKKRRYVMPESRKKHLSEIMKMRWRVLKHTTKTHKV